MLRGKTTMIRSFTNAVLVALMVFSLVVSPVFAQAQEGQNPPSQGTPSPDKQGQQGQPTQPEHTQHRETQNPPGSKLKEQPQPPAAKEARAMKMSLGPDYAKGKPFFP